MRISHCLAFMIYTLVSQFGTLHSIDWPNAQSLADLLLRSRSMVAECYPTSSSSGIKASGPPDVEKQTSGGRDEPLLGVFAATYAHWLVSVS